MEIERLVGGTDGIELRVVRAAEDTRKQAFWPPLVGPHERTRVPVWLQLEMGKRASHRPHRALQLKVPEIRKGSASPSSSNLYPCQYAVREHPATPDIWSGRRARTPEPPADAPYSHPFSEEHGHPVCTDPQDAEQDRFGQSNYQNQVSLVRLG